MSQNNEMEKEITEEELMAMLQEIEQEIGLEEMNRRLTAAMENMAEANPDSAAEKLLLIQKGNFEEMLLLASEADFSNAETVEKLLHSYYENESEEAFAALIMEIGWCMLNGGAVLVPTITRNDILDMPLLGGETEDENWIPLYTSAEAAKGWPEEAVMEPVELELMTLMATVKSDFSGIVLNPGTPEPMPLDKEMLFQMQRACNDTREEEVRLANEEVDQAMASCSACPSCASGRGQNGEQN
jgi:hypothetical protein